MGMTHVLVAKQCNHLLHSHDCSDPLHGTALFAAFGRTYGFAVTVTSANNADISLCCFDSIPRFPESGSELV